VVPRSAKSSTSHDKATLVLFKKTKRRKPPRRETRRKEIKDAFTVFYFLGATQPDSEPVDPAT